MLKNLFPSKEKETFPEVFIMTSQHRWDDPRIFYKQGISLAQKYNVELHAPAEKRSFVREGIKIVPLPRYIKRYFRPLNWIRLLWRGLRSKCRVIHLHDYELLPVGYLIKLLSQKKIIYDVHEDFPASIEYKSWIPSRFRPFLSRLLGRAEKWFSKKVDALIFAEEYYHELFAPVKTLKIGVYNYPPLNLIPYSSKTQKNKNIFNIVYSGGISEPRGASIMVKALSRVNWKGKNFRLILIGPVQPEQIKNELLVLADKLGLSGKLTFTGLISWEKVSSYYTTSDLGLALLRPEKNYVRSMATKIFEYMAAGLPVLASDFPEWNKLVEGNGCGFNVNPLDEDLIAQKIEFMLNCPDLRYQMGINGYSAFLQKYNWRRQEEKLWFIYENLLAGGTKVLHNE